MLDEIIKSIKANLYERATSPLLGTYAVAWCLWNYRFLLILISDLDVSEKLSRIDSIFFPSIQSYLAAFGFPLAATVLFIFIYPYPAKFVYGFWRRRQKELKEIRQKIEDETPLTKEEARELRSKLNQLQAEYEHELGQRNDEIKDLRSQLQEMSEPMTTKAMTYAIPKHPVQVKRPTISDEGLSVKQLELLKLISESGSPLSIARLRGAAQETMTRTDFNIGELERYGLIRSTGIDMNGEPSYAVTHDGRGVLIQSGLVS